MMRFIDEQINGAARPTILRTESTTSTLCTKS